MVSSGAGVLVQWVLLAVCLMALVGRGSAVTLCNIYSNKLFNCLPAVSSKLPQLPNEKCCAIVCQAALPCLSKYKSVLPALGFDAAHAAELPEKCGLKPPQECHVS